MGYIRGKRLRIEKAKGIGFCLGVRRAIELVKKSAQEYGSLEVLGPLVHNKRVIENLSVLGVKTVQSLSQLQGPIVVIPSHGFEPRIKEEIEAKGFRILDATCPIVQRAQIKASELHKAGFSVIIFGNKEHPEVRGVLGYSGDKGIAVLKREEITFPFPKRLGIISQTTQSVENFAKFVKSVIDALPYNSEVKIVNTICPIIRKRQEEALNLSQKVELMLVIGDRDSANTRQLYEICASKVRTYLVEGIKDIDKAWLNAFSIGITSGASTPDEIVIEIIEYLKELGAEG